MSGPPVELVSACGQLLCSATVETPDVREREAALRRAVEALLTMAGTVDVDTARALAGAVRRDELTSAAWSAPEPTAQPTNLATAAPRHFGLEALREAAAMRYGCKM